MSKPRLLPVLVLLCLSACAANPKAFHISQHANPPGVGAQVWRECFNLTLKTLWEVEEYRAMDEAEQDCVLLASIRSCLANTQESMLQEGFMLPPEHFAPNWESFINEALKAHCAPPPEGGGTPAAREAIRRMYQVPHEQLMCPAP